MASKRQSNKRIIPQPLRQRKAKISHIDKLKFVAKYKKISDPSNERAISREYKSLRQFPLHLLRPANKTQRDELKRRGFFVTEKGVIIDGPRDANRQPISGAKLTISKTGDMIFISKNKRKDFISGFTKEDKKEFAKDPNTFIARRVEELKKKYPTLRNAKTIQVRIQWGAYQATKDFYPGYFTRIGSGKDEIEKINKKQKDKLTGLHIVAHGTKENENEKPVKSRAKNTANKKTAARNKKTVEPSLVQMLFDDFEEYLIEQEFEELMLNALSGENNAPKKKAKKKAAKRSKKNRRT